MISEQFKEAVEEAKKIRTSLVLNDPQKENDYLRECEIYAAKQGVRLEYLTHE